MGRTKTGGVC